MRNTLAKILVIAFVAFGLGAKAATVDTALTYSNAMHKSIKAVVVKPGDYSAGKKFPVVYLLHGYSGNYADWTKNDPDKTSIQQLCDRYDVLIVCADGNFSSWYLDSPIDPAWKYETYVATELVNYIDSHYSTIKDRSGRAITGLSMGGHGALYIAFKHLDKFGAAGSMSGAVDIRPFPDSFGIERVLGKYSEHPDRWEQNSVVNLIYLLKPNSLAITFDVGYDDFLYQANQELHEKLLERKVPHDYTVRPGGHTWEFWGNSINYQALFFSRFFEGIK